MSIVLFKEITTEEALTELEAEGKKYTGLYVDMDDKKQRKYIKDSAAHIASLLKKVERARIDKSKEYKSNIEAEAKSITARLEAANSPFSSLIELHNDKRKAILAEEKRIADEKEADRLAVIAQAERDDHHEMAFLMMADDLRKRAESAEQDRLDKIAHDKAIALEAKQKAEEAAADEIAEAERLKQAAIVAAKAAEDKAEQDLIDSLAREKRLAAESVERERLAAEKTKLDAEKAEQHRVKQAQLAREQAEREKQEAIQQEKQRQIDEQARIDREAKAREADTDNKKAVNNAALEAVSYHGCIDPEDAKNVIIAIASGKIPNVTINY